MQVVIDLTVYFDATSCARSETVRVYPALVLVIRRLLANAQADPGACCAVNRWVTVPLPGRTSLMDLSVRGV